MSIQGRSNITTLLDALTSLALPTVAALPIWTSVQQHSKKSKGDPRPLPAALVSLNGVPIKGGKGAAVGIIEFLDYQCPFCARFEKNTMPAIDAAYLKDGRSLRSSESAARSGTRICS